MKISYSMDTGSGMVDVDEDLSNLFITAQGNNLFLGAMVPNSTGFVAVMVEKVSCSKVYVPYFVGKVLPEELMELDDEVDSEFVGCAAIDFKLTPLRLHPKRPYLYSGDWEGEGELKVFVLFLPHDECEFQPLDFNSHMSEDELELRVAMYSEVSRGGGFSVSFTAEHSTP